MMEVMMHQLVRRLWRDDKGAPRLEPPALARLFLEPRTHVAWLGRPVPATLLEEAWQLARLAPTGANCSPLRLVLLRTAEEKERLTPALAADNRCKALEAP